MPYLGLACEPSGCYHVIHADMVTEPRMGKSVARQFFNISTTLIDVFYRVLILVHSMHLHSMSVPEPVTMCIYA